VFHMALNGPLQSSVRGFLTPLETYEETLGKE
jgi:hypothetical protein